VLGYLEGKILSKNEESSQLLLLTQGVGYEVFVTKKTLLNLALQEPASLWIHSHVREDAFILFGFESEDDKAIFRLLLSVSGLGPKTALSLINEHSNAALLEAILRKNSAFLSQAPGVGKKLAEKIILELQSKVEKSKTLAKIPKETKQAVSQTAMEGHFEEDIQSALVHLGFHPQSVRQHVLALAEEKDLKELGFENALKMLLKRLTFTREVNA